jgi:hypothetical protein
MARCGWCRDAGKAARPRRRRRRTAVSRPLHEAAQDWSTLLLWPHRVAKHRLGRPALGLDRSDSLIRRRDDFRGLLSRRSTLQDLAQNRNGWRSCTSTSDTARLHGSPNKSYPSRGDAVTNAHAAAPRLSGELLDPQYRWHVRSVARPWRPSRRAIPRSRAGCTWRQPTFGGVTGCSPRRRASLANRSIGGQPRRRFKPSDRQDGRRGLRSRGLPCAVSFRISRDTTSSWASARRRGRRFADRFSQRAESFAGAHRSD